MLLVVIGTPRRFVTGVDKNKNNNIRIDGSSKYALVRKWEIFAGTVKLNSSCYMQTWNGIVLPIEQR